MDRDDLLRGMGTLLAAATLRSVPVFAEYLPAHGRAILELTLTPVAAEPL